MKRILLHGYTAANLGDDLFFRVITDRYPHTEFVIPTLRVDCKDSFSDVKNLKIVDFFKVAKLTNRKTYMLPSLYSKLFLNNFDAVVCIGGSLFIDSKNPTKKHRIEVENYSFIHDWELAKNRRIPYYILGANWGPCYNDYFFDYFNNAFDNVSDVYFRDKESFNIFADKKNVRHGADILLGSEYVKKAGAVTSKKKQIAVSVVNPSYKGGDDVAYISKMSELVDEFTEKGYSVVLMSFCATEGDEKTIAEIYGKLDNTSSVSALNYTNNHAELLRCIAASEYVLASRFHATVLAWTLGVPAFSVAYSNKTTALLSDFDCLSSGIKIEEIENLTAESVFKRATVPTSVHSVEIGAFDKLDLFLRG